MKRTPIRRVSTKRTAQNRTEAALKAAMFDAAPWCARCGYSTTDPTRLDKHELLSRARLGDPTDEANCVLLCRPCHDLVTFRHHEIDDADRWVLSRGAA